MTTLPVPSLLNIQRSSHACPGSLHCVSCAGSADSRTRSAASGFHHQLRMRKPHPLPHSLSTRAKSYFGLVTTMYEHTMMKHRARQGLTPALGTNNFFLRTRRAERCWPAKIYFISGSHVTRRTSQADTALRQGSSVCLGKKCTSVKSERSHTMAFDVSQSTMRSQSRLLY
jgi:hypothetical protein